MYVALFQFEFMITFFHLKSCECVWRKWDFSWNFQFHLFCYLTCIFFACLLTYSVSQFYIQLLFRPHLGTWTLPFRLLGSKWKISETMEFLLNYATFWGGFFMFWWSFFLLLLFFFYIVGSALKSCLIKFGHSEKGTKFKKIFHFQFDIT